MTKGCAQTTASRFDIIIKDVFNTRTEMENVSVRGKILLNRPQPVMLPGELWDVLAGLCEVIQVADIQYFKNWVVGHSIQTNYSTSKWF